MEGCVCEGERIGVVVGERRGWGEEEMGERGETGREEEGGEKSE